MCGIVMYSSSKHAVDETKLRWLLKENLSRGRDGTGVFTVKQDKHRTQTLYKTTAESDIFIQSKGFKEAVRGAISVVGHVRGASVQSTVSNENSHPYMYGEGKDLIVGVHNGFIIPQLVEETHKRFGFEKEFPVDSQLIFAALAKNHGDWKILSEIEGAITVAWMQPNEHPGVIFVYRRTSRELHLAFTRGGIYFSSEAQPLRLIGTDSIWPVSNNNLLIIKDGVLIDLLELPPPKIFGLSINCSRSYWEHQVPEEQYKDLVPGLIKPKHREAGFKSYSNRHGGAESVDDTEIFRSSQGTSDEFGLLLADVRSELKGLELNEIKFNESVSIPVPDASSCIMMLKVVDSVQQMPLPACVVMDEEDPIGVSGVTCLNGVTALKFTDKQCGKARKLLVYGPIEEAKGYILNAAPVCGTVMEVTVSLPFSKKKAAGAGKSKSKALQGLENKLIRHGDNQCNLRIPPGYEHKSILPPAGSYKAGVSEQGDESFRPSEEGSLFGVQKTDRNEDVVLLPLEGDSSKRGVTAGAVHLKLKQVNKFLSNAGALDSYPIEVGRVLIEWAESPIANLIKVGRLGYEASHLNMFYKKERLLHIPVVSFMIWLLQHQPAEYLKKAPMSADDVATIRKYLWYTYGVVQFPAPVV